MGAFWAGRALVASRLHVQNFGGLRISRQPVRFRDDTLDLVRHRHNPSRCGRRGLPDPESAREIVDKAPILAHTRRQGVQPGDGEAGKGTG
jgi:hypothetical protein